MRKEPERVIKVNQIADRMRQAFIAMGFKTGKSSTPIIPLFIGNSELTFMTWKTLFDNGIFVNATVPPAVTPGNELLRTSYMATHTEEQLNQILTICQTVGKQVGLLK
jgi:8-amino-7-oxononanoate synthase